MTKRRLKLINSVDVANQPADEDDTGEPGYIVEDPPPQPEPATPQRPKFAPIAATKIAGMEFPPLRWAVLDFLPEGLSILAGPPKAGKSLLATHMCACIAAGRKFLGYDVARGGALYIDGETDARGFKRRLHALGWQEGAEGLLFFSAPAGWLLDSDGIDDLDRFRAFDPDLRLVVIDTLQRLVPQSPGAKFVDAYQQGVARLGPLQKWASSQSVCVLLVHHTGKHSNGGETFDAMSGSRGLTATAENLLTLTRVERDRFKLSITSRHMANLELAIEREGPTWSILGDFEEATMSDERRTLLEFFQENPDSTIKEASVALDRQYGITQRAISRMAKSGQLIRGKRGRYSVNPVSVWSESLNETDKQTDQTGGYLSRAREERDLFSGGRPMEVRS